MYKKIVFAAVGIALLSVVAPVAPFSASAETFVRGGGTDAVSQYLQTQTDAQAKSLSDQLLKFQQQLNTLNLTNIQGGTTETAPTQTYQNTLLGDAFQTNTDTNTTTAVSPLDTSCVDLDGALSLGSDGDVVTKLQKYLIGKKFLADGNSTGHFGPLTQAAVQSLQASLGIASSGSPDTNGWGIVGPRTIAAIRCTGDTPTTQVSADAVVFSWSPAGPIAGRTCVNMSEGSAPTAYTWFDNYVCTSRDIGLKWSSAGALPGMRCSQINEPSEPAAYTWTDNYLCVPQDSSVQLQWSHAGAVPGKQCVNINEPSDPNTWTDNYLCYVEGALQPKDSGKITLYAFPTSGAAPFTTTFSLSGGTKSDPIAFGDGSVGSAWTADSESNLLFVNHTFTAPGSYTASVSSHGQTARASISATAAASASCSFSGSTIANGATVTAYQSLSVASGQSCAQETRTCTNGTLSGSYTNASCAIQTAVVDPYTQQSLPQTLGQLVDHLYGCALGRAADSGGRTGWVSSFQNGNSYLDVLGSFFNSAEYAGKSASDQSFVQSLYHCALFRDSDPAGLSSNLNLLQAHAQTRSDLMRGFLSSQEFLSSIAPTIRQLTGVAHTLPTATLSADSPSILVGQTTTIRAAFAAGQSDTLTATNIDQPEGAPASGWGTADGLPTASRTFTFTPTAPGTYTFYGRITTQHYPSWASYGTVTVNVTRPASANTFRILVDTNLLGGYGQVDDAHYRRQEIDQAARYAADGASIITINSPSQINWTTTLSALNAGTWAISEGDPQEDLDGRPSSVGYTDLDFISQKLGRIPDNTMIYSESSNPAGTVVTDQTIANFAAHTVPGFGPVGARIVVMARAYVGPWQTAVNHALQNPNVAGLEFEANPDNMSMGTYQQDVGCRYALSLGKKCYFLLPPNSAGEADYLGDMQRLVSQLAQSGGLLNNRNFYIVVATYVQYDPGPTHYLSTSAGDHESVEATVAWLKAYRSTIAVAPSNGTLSNLASTLTAFESALKKLLGMLGK